MKKLLARLFLAAAVVSAGTLTVSLQSAEACKGNHCKRCATKGKDHKNCQCKNCQHQPSSEDGKAPAEADAKKSS